MNFASSFGGYPSFKCDVTDGIPATFTWRVYYSIRPRGAISLNVIESGVILAKPSGDGMIMIGRKKYKNTQYIFCVQNFRYSYVGRCCSVKHEFNTIKTT